MITITERDCIRAVCEKWAHQYTPFDRHSPDKLVIYNQLLRLDLETCSAKDIEDIIGNGSWTRLECNECGNKTDWVLQVGEEPDYESRTARLCMECVKKAVAYLG